MEKILSTSRSRKWSKTSKDRLESTIGSLPREVMLDVISRLPITSLMNVKQVCRSWRNIALDPVLVDVHFSRAAKIDPCLILHGDFPVPNQLYAVDLSVRGDTDDQQLNLERIRVPIMEEFNLIGSCNGLVCLCDSLHKSTIRIYNPFTSNQIELPKPVQISEQQQVAFGFGLSPVTKEYKVVRIVYYKKQEGGNPHPLRYPLPRAEAQIFTLGSSTHTWRRVGNISHQIAREPSHVLLNGRLHWVTCRYRNHPLRKIISFDLAEEEFREVPCPNSGIFGRQLFHLVVLEDRLSAIVHHCRGELVIWVMKEYNAMDSWVKEFTIGAYLPRELEQNVDNDVQDFGTSGLTSNRTHNRVLCRIKNGEILLLYRSKDLVCYDPNFGTFKKLHLQGFSKLFECVVHVSSLNWIDTV